MSSSRLRLALVASLACTLPPVSRHSRKHSMVPAASAPFSAAARLPATWSRIQAILVPEKYGSRIRPVLAVTSSSCPARFSSSQRSAVRRSCQTMALWIGLPVAAVPHDRGLALVGDADAGQRLGVELRLGERVAADLDRGRPDLLGDRARPSRAWGRSAAAPSARDATGRPVASNTMARVLVVPWSMARMCLAAILRS